MYKRDQKVLTMALFGLILKKIHLKDAVGLILVLNLIAYTFKSLLMPLMQTEELQEYMLHIMSGRQCLETMLLVLN
jgi:hypothetical protein